MKKNVSILFQVNFAKAANTGPDNRTFSLYRQLRRKRRLARFCREAFMEKAVRQLDGLETSYRQLDQLIKTKGLLYILESVQQKEAQVASTNTNPAMNPQEEPEMDAAIEADRELVDETDTSMPDLPIPNSEGPDEPVRMRPATDEPDSSTIHPADLEKLKNLL